MKAGDDLEVITKTYDLRLWFLPLIAKMPRSHRFTLGDRLEVGLDLLDRLIEHVEASTRRLRFRH